VSVLSFLQLLLELLISAPSLGVNYFLSLTLSVCPSVTLLQIASSFLFLDGIEPFFGRQFSPWHSTKRCSLTFDLGPLSPKIYCPTFVKFAQNYKLPISQLVWQIDRRCLGLLGGFRGWLIEWNQATCCGADPCCHGNEIWARHGDPVVYRLVADISKKSAVNTVIGPGLGGPVV